MGFLAGELVRKRETHHSHLLEVISFLLSTIGEVQNFLRTALWRRLLLDSRELLHREPRAPQLSLLRPIPLSRPRLDVGLLPLHRNGAERMLRHAFLGQPCMVDTAVSLLVTSHLRAITIRTENRAIPTKMDTCGFSARCNAHRASQLIHHKAGSRAVKALPI